jgi:hypothetical protein
MNWLYWRDISACQWDDVYEEFVLYWLSHLLESCGQAYELSVRQSYLDTS